MTVFAYITNSLPVARLGANDYTINVCGLGLLAVSILAGFCRLQYILHYLQIAAKRVDSSDILSKIEKAAMKEKQLTRPGLGPMSSDEVIQKHQEHNDRLQWATKRLEEENKKIAILYHTRNATAFLAMIAFAVAKIIRAYL